MKALRLLGDEGRIRLLRLLAKEELSVAELQEILGMGQSRISMQLSQLKSGGLVQMRRSGQKSLYSAVQGGDGAELLAVVLERAGREIGAASRDDDGLRLILERRKDHLRAYFDDLAGRFGRDYVPGRGWKALSEMLLRLLPPLVIADLGAGEGTLSLLLAQRTSRVIAVDNARKMVEYGTEVARRHGVDNLEYRLGDLEELPIEPNSVDLALFHQSLHHALHPGKALQEAKRILRPGGRVVILDLLRHDFEGARELYGDVWLGFTQVELLELLRESEFTNIDVSPVHREEEAPFFETLLAIADRPAG